MTMRLGRGGGIQDHDQGAARRADRGRSRRRVNHTAEATGPAPCSASRESTFGVLPPDAGQARVRERHRLRQHVNCAHPQVRALIVDCLKYWAEEMHVDGFRFDLATVLARDANGFNERSALFKAIRAEPSLRRVKLIAEPWDIGWGGYQLEDFPPAGRNGRPLPRHGALVLARDAARIGELAERFAGSSDLFHTAAASPPPTSIS